MWTSRYFAGGVVQNLQNQSLSGQDLVPEEMRSGLPQYCNEVNAVRMPHYASVIIACFRPVPLKVPVAGDVVVHNVHTLVLPLLHLVVDRERIQIAAWRLRPEGIRGSNGMTPQIRRVVICDIQQ